MLDRHHRRRARARCRLGLGRFHGTLWRADALPLGPPEICVEVRSPSDTDAEMAHKSGLYLEAGAVEEWIVAEQGAWQVFGAQGEQPATAYPVKL